jgi:hypothetical protein
VLDVETLRTLIQCDFETGDLFWKKRPTEFFKSEKYANAWNARFANMPALHALNKHGYRYGAIFGRIALAHRVVYALANGEWPLQIDHINGQKADNRPSNLRSVCQAENSKNLSKSRRNTSGVTGVSWYAQTCSWRVQIRANGVAKCLGYFKRFDEAVACRKVAEAKHGYHENHGRLRHAICVAKAVNVA